MDEHIKMAESLIQTNGMMAISTLDAYELYRLDHAIPEAKKRTMKKFLITSTELEKRLKMAKRILDDPSERSIYVSIYAEIQYHIDTVNQLISTTHVLSLNSTS